jgi:hypothetical protein
MKKWNECDKTDRVMAITTIVIAGCTVLLLVISAVQIWKYIDAVHVENRAYVNLETIDDIRIMPLDSIKFAYRFVNVGKTPARFVFPVHVIIQGEMGDSFAIKLKNIIDNVDKQGFVEGSNIPLSKTIYSNWIMSEDDYASFWKKEKPVYVLGLIKYYDIFNERHYTWFCYNLLPDGTYTAYPQYNDAD